MNKQTIIPAGYRLTVTTWENDADNYKTVILEGLDEAAVRFYVELARLFEHSRDYSTRICNLYEPGEDALARLATASRKLFSRFPEALSNFDTPLEELDEDDVARDCLSEMTSTIGVSGTGEFYTRVVSEFKVEHVPNEIVLSDVTSEF